MINKNIRKYVYEEYKEISNIFSILPDISDEIIMKMLFCNIDEIKDENEKKTEYVKQYYMTSVMFSDLYKVLNEKYKSNILNETEERMWALLNASSSLENFIKLFISPDIKIMLIKGTIDFYESNVFGKIGMHKCLNDGQINHLMSICPTFKEDLDIYDREFTLNNYLEYTLKYKNHLTYDIGYLDEATKFDAISTVKNHFLRLYDYNPDEPVLLELDKYVSKMGAFLESKGIHIFGYDKGYESFSDFYNDFRETDDFNYYLERTISFWLSVETSCNQGTYNIKGTEFEREEFEGYDYGDENKKK